MQITKDSIIGDVLDMDAGCAPMFLEMGYALLRLPFRKGRIDCRGVRGSWCRSGQAC